MRFLVLLIFFGIISCRTVNPKFDIEPTCLQDVVEKILAEPPSKIPVEIKQGFYEGKEIFVITEKKDAGLISIILNSDCESLVGT